MKAIIYARYSSDNQREESIEGQVRECMEYAERNGIVVIDTYIDRALSAKTDNRPNFQKMIRDSYKGLFDLVIVWKLDRLPVIVMIARTTKRYSKRMASKWFPQENPLRKARKESCLNRFWKAMQNISPQTLPKKLHAV